MSAVDVPAEAPEGSNNNNEVAADRQCRLKLQVTGLETECRKDVLIDTASTIRMMKDLHFQKEIGEGCNIRVFHAGKMLRDHDTVAKLDGEFVHCFLSRLKAPVAQTPAPIAPLAPSAMAGAWPSAPSQPHEDGVHDLSGMDIQLSLWPTIMGINNQQPIQLSMTMTDGEDLSQCAVGLHDNMIEWPTITGLFCGLCFFPWGMMVCLFHRQVRCRRCGTRVDIGV